MSEKKARKQIGKGKEEKKKKTERDSKERDRKERDTDAGALLRTGAPEFSTLPPPPPLPSSTANAFCNHQQEVIDATFPPNSCRWCEDQQGNKYVNELH